MVALPRICRKNDCPVAERLWRDVRGGVLALVAVAIVPLIGFVGIGTDVARGFMVKSRLSSALDAAGLAGGKAFYAATRDQDIAMFFNANFPPGYMGATVAGPTVTIDSDSETVHLAASATVPTAFMHLFGFETLTVAAEAEVTRRMEMLDVVLAMDMSGSMASSAGGGLSRIEATRQAATSLVDILFGTEATKDLLTIGLVPWNGKVNVTIDGTTYDPALNITESAPTFTNPLTGQSQDVLHFAANSPVPLLSAPDDDWRGCVFGRFLDDGDEDTDADTRLGPVAMPGADWMGWEPIGPEGEPVDDNVIELVQSAAGANRSNALTVNWPQTPTAGNVLVALGSRRDGQFDVPAGWVSLHAATADDGGPSFRTRVFARLAGGTESALTVTAGDDRQQALTIAEFEGLDGSGLLEAARATDLTGSTGTSVPLGAVWADSDGDLLLAVAALADIDFTSFAWSNGFAPLAAPQAAAGAGTDITHAAAYRIKSSSGSYGTTLSSFGGGAEERWGSVVALDADTTCKLAANGIECSACLSHGITPLGNSKATILDAIDALQHPAGTTNIPQGLGWAWRVLKPDAPFTEAVPDPELPRQQAIVLLTDGENFGGSGDGYKTVFGYGDAARPAMDARLLQLAANIKASGVVIYVIQFANAGTDLQTLLQQVASGPAAPFYYHAPDAATLQNVFHEIANHLSELRLSK